MPNPDSPKGTCSVRWSDASTGAQSSDAELDRLQLCYRLPSKVLRIETSVCARQKPHNICFSKKLKLNRDCSVPALPEQSHSMPTCSFSGLCRGHKATLGGG